MASTGEVWKLGHRPALDGVRGVAILLVLVCHAFSGQVAAAGSVGVTLFFTLSGFLITGQLLEQQEHDGRIGLRRFFRARAYRLLPAAVVVVTVCSTFLIYAGLPLRDTAAIAGPVLFYVGNWTAMGYVSSGYALLQHTWSLAVEEQFYLLWPFVLILLARGRLRVPAVAFVGVTVAASLYAVAARIVLWDGGAGQDRIYLGTDTHADALLVGCLLAFAVRRLGPRRPPRWLFVASVAGLTACSAAGDGYLRFVVATTLVPLFAVPVLLEAITSDAGWLTWRPLALAGQVSYGMYLWNYPLAWVAPVMLAPVVGAVAAGLLVVVGSFALAGLSWVLVERPFLQIKARGYCAHQDKSLSAASLISASVNA